MSLWFLLVAPLIFQIITDGHPLVTTDQLADADSLGLWDSGDLSSEQPLSGASGGDFLFDGSDTAGYDLFTSDSSSYSNGIENDLGLSSSPSDLGWISMDATTGFALDSEPFGDNFAETPSCTYQARKRDGSTDTFLGSVIISSETHRKALLTVPESGVICHEREENGKKEDPGNSNPQFRSPFDVEPWTCPLDFFKMCCTGLISPDGRAFGCSYCKTTISLFSYSISARGLRIFW